MNDLLSLKKTATSGMEMTVEAENTLHLLQALQDDHTHTQRTLSRELGIALGLANTYLKRCVKKGLVKISQAPANRYTYYLTPKGFAEKSHLTAEYLSQSFNLFRAARTQYRALIEHCLERGWSRLVLVGTGDLAEIATLCRADCPDAVLVGLLDPHAQVDSLAGLPVAATIAGLPPFDAVLVADLRDPQGAYERVRDEVGDERVLAPRFLNLVRQRPPVMMEDEQ